MKKNLLKLIQIGTLGLISYTLAFLLIHAFSYSINKLEIDQDLRNHNQSIVFSMK
ncbi:MAG: hypothetical protein RSE91_02345 [Bacilli bacterium]